MLSRPAEKRIADACTNACVCVCVSADSVRTCSSSQSHIASSGDSQVEGLVRQHPSEHWAKENNKPLRVYIPLAVFDSNTIEKESDISDRNR